ncbi:beta-propeller domain-containing protein [Miltoncostaea oceani]|uniref:beta-propeller domain-containing protein n=1 Tax=Miltoncostaea oceani TaxID=2843216 RepID=UPI001C3C7AC5|nr:beta-propeller domain-containing protein [Miltoncostaea oceani]
MGRSLVVCAVAGLGVAAVVAGGAGGPAGGGAPRAEDASAPRPALTRFATCDRFVAHVRRRALASVGPWGLTGSTPVAVAAPVAEGDPVRAAAPAPALAPGTDFSDTNVQEAGVDEPDLVETDGRTVFAIAGGRLEAVDATGAAPRALPGLDLPGMSPSGLLLMGDRLLVIGDAGTPGPPRPVLDTVRIAPAPPVPPVTVVVALDVSDPAAPRVLSRMRAEGSLVSARRTGGTVRLVVSSHAPHLDLVTPAGAARGTRAALRANRRAIAAAPAGAWLPRVTVRDAATGRTVRRAVPCSAVSRPSRFAGLGTVSVLTVGVSDTLSLLDTDAVLTDGELVYASPTAMYVATARWSPPSAADAPVAPRGATLIHKLDTSDPTRTTYRASGVVPGYLLNQFSLSEHAGHLRVASTEEPDWWSPPEGAEPSESRITVLAQDGGRLVRTGEVRGLGRGERIHAVRFLGDRGYVVTFRQTDPLYVLDLADPARPVLRGELKIPGFSSYLHPVDATTLIGVGQAADARGRTQGTQVSLFDVTDPARPSRIAQRTLDTDWSEAESDHHAFLYWPANRLLVLPAQRYDGSGGAPFLGAVGLDVSRTTGITPIARITHPGGPDAAWAPVRRSLVVGGAVLTVSETGVLASDLTTLAPRGWAPFD